MHSNQVKSLIEKHGPMTLNDIKSANAIQQRVRNRTQSLPRQRVNSEESSSDESDLLNSDKKRLSRQERGEREEGRSSSENRSYKEGIPHMYGTVLIGDDFLLGVACFYLKFFGNFDNKVFNSGYCKSGQTIQDATEHIKELIEEDDASPKAGLVYLGASDIVMGKKFFEMKKDLDEFVIVCQKRKFNLVLCTLTPIPSHQVGGRALTLKTFNSFLANNTYDLPVIDIHKGFMRTADLFEEYYFTENAFKITGSKERVVLWSREGQHKFYSMILKNIGFALLATTTRVFYDE